MTWFGKQTFCRNRLIKLHRQCLQCICKRYTVYICPWGYGYEYLVNFYIRETQLRFEYFHVKRSCSIRQASKCASRCNSYINLVAIYLITAIPPIYGCRAAGIFTEPSALRLFSRKAISILGGATTVLFKVCAKYLPSFPSTRIFRRRA